MTRERRPISARALILGAILTVAALGLAIVGGVTFLAQRDRVLTTVDARLASQVKAINDVADLRVIVENPGPGTEPAPDEFVDVGDYLRAAVSRLIPGRNEANVAVIDGEIAFRTSGALSEAMADNPAFIAQAVESAERSLDKGRAPSIAEATVGATSLRYIAVPVTLPDDPREGVYIRAVSVTSEFEPVLSSLWTFTVAAFATLAATGFVGWFVAGRILSPIRHLRETADSITIADLGVRIPADGIDDISDLTRTVNSMLDRLEGSVDVQRQLLDDVRHELKTPITIVRGHLEMMDASDPADVQATRELGMTELDRLTRLVEDIDLLSSVEGDQFVIGPVDIGVLTARMGDLVTAIPGHSWSIAHTAGGIIHGDEDRLLQAWLQLADNAAKYTPAGTHIEIGSELAIEGARLWVRDHGNGIPPAARRRIFRRFDRAGSQRTVGGSGLGLAIVDAIAKAHNGACVVTDTPGGGATFTIMVPITPLDLHSDLPAPVRAGDVVLQREASG